MRETGNSTSRMLVICLAILTAAFSRILPHPPNFTPIAAMALFGGVFFSDRRLAFLFPLAAMILSDLILGFHQLAPLVYGAFALTVSIGLWIRTRLSSSTILIGTIAASLLFFLVTNFGVWFFEGMYPKTSTGLVACYTAAIPFFRNEIIGDLLYAGVMFGAFLWAEKWFPVFQEGPNSNSA